MFAHLLSATVVALAALLTQTQRDIRVVYECCKRSSCEQMLV